MIGQPSTHGEAPSGSENQSHQRSTVLNQSHKWVLMDHTDSLVFAPVEPSRKFSSSATFDTIFYITHFYYYSAQGNCKGKALKLQTLCAFS